MNNKFKGLALSKLSIPKGDETSVRNDSKDLRSKRESKADEKIEAKVTKKEPKKEFKKEFKKGLISKKKTTSNRGSNWKGNRWTKLKALRESQE